MLISMMEKQAIFKLFLLALEIYDLSSSNPDEGDCGDDEHIKCCFNFVKKNGKCIPCPPGSYGINCSLKCPKDYYGNLCRTKCNCKNDEICHPISGCSPYGVCDAKRHQKCCVGFFEEKGKCVRCPVGRFGINCSLTCPFGFYGSGCKKECKCQSDQRCHPETGCFQYANAGNVTDVDNQTERRNLTIPITIVIVFIVLTSSAFMTIFIIKRFNLCVNRLKFLPGFCMMHGSTPARTDDVENMRESSVVLKSQAERDSRANQDCENKCIIATKNDIYDDTNNELKEEYDLLELRVRNV